ncbi:MAG TPA: hypothetical protein VGV14_02805 [Rhodanobacter sp.]|nr:hypothetical protein [Rhodanobacter sp.]
MSIIEKLKAKIQNSVNQPLEAIAQPMLDRISERVTGGLAPVWCKASWGSGCDAVNQASSSSNVIAKPSV